jgi:hypothetical protein
MPDGDSFDQHGRMWWKTASRKLFERIETFETSAVWSIKKMFRDESLAAFRDLTDVLIEAFDLRAHGVDGRVFIDSRLREIERQHLDLDSQTAIRLARDILTDATVASEIQRTPVEQRPERVGCHLVARLAVENCCMPALVHALQRGSSFSLERIRVAKESGIRELHCSADLINVVRQQLQQGPEIIVQAVATPRLRTRVDQESLVHSASAFGD